MQKHFAWRVAAVFLLATPAAAVDVDKDVYTVELSSLAPDVYLVHRPGPLREPVEPNAVFVVNAEDVVVFEGGGAPLVAERTIALIRTVTSKPVSHLINSHWHGDHNLGNQVYRAEYPDVRVVRSGTIAIELCEFPSVSCGSWQSASQAVRAATPPGQGNASAT